MLLCSRFAHHSHRQALHIFPRPGNFATHFQLQINPQLFHSSPVIFHLRKAPQSKNKIFGINLTYLPWASQFMRQWIRKKTHPHMLGVKTDRDRNKMVQNMAIFYAVLAWTMLGYMMYWLKNKYTDNIEDVKSGSPYEEEVGRGGALWWIANSGRTDIKEDDDIYVWKVKGFSVEKERVTHKAQAVTEAVRLQADAKSDDITLRRMLGLPLSREDGMSDEDLKAAVEALGKDYELELDLVKQQNRRKEMEDRTDEELKALGTIEGKVKLFGRQLRRKVRSKMISDGTESKTKDSESEEFPAESDSKDQGPLSTAS